MLTLTCKCNPFMSIELIVLTLTCNIYPCMPNKTAHPYCFSHDGMLIVRGCRGVYMYVDFSKLFHLLNVPFIKETRVDCVEMPRYAASHLGLRKLLTTDCTCTLS